MTSFSSIIFSAFVFKIKNCPKSYLEWKFFLRVIICTTSHKKKLTFVINYFLKFINSFITSCCTGSLLLREGFLAVMSRAALRWGVCGLLIVIASLIVEHRLQYLHCSGLAAPWMWISPDQGSNWCPLLLCRWILFFFN